MKEIWQNLYNEALNKINPKKVTSFIDSGYISCAILTASNEVYTGVNIQGNSSINICAEKNAIVNMINNGSNDPVKLVIVNELGEIIKPCQACYDYLIDFSYHIDDLELLVDLKDFKTVKLKSLLPDWWGTFRVQKKD